MVTHEDMKEIAREAAEQAVEKIMLRLGIDPRDPESLARARDNFGFLARMNRGAKQVSNAIVKTCAGAFVTAILGLIALGIKDHFIK